MPTKKTSDILSLESIRKRWSECGDSPLSGCDSDENDCSIVNHVLLSSDGTEMTVNNFTFEVPPHATPHQKTNSTVACAGCQELLPCFESQAKSGHFKIKYSLKYYFHIFSCFKYWEKDLLKKCFDCKLVFRCMEDYRAHSLQEHTPKPDWMTDKIYKNSRKPNKYETIMCPARACCKLFKAKIKNKGRTAEFGYFAHCVEKCKGYKRLGLLSTCLKCDKIFLDEKTFNRHHAKRHTTVFKLFGEPVRSWMCPDVKNGKRRFWTYDTTISCEGCGQKFPYQTAKKQPHRAFHIHCVEECPKMKAMRKITVCSKCSCKFINRLSNHCDAPLQVVA